MTGIGAGDYDDEDGDGNSDGADGSSPVGKPSLSLDDSFDGSSSPVQATPVAVASSSSKSKPLTPKAKSGVGFGSGGGGVTGLAASTLQFARHRRRDMRQKRLVDLLVGVGAVLRVPPSAVQCKTHSANGLAV